jgi:glucuronoarabinoxylan endo-1,4-beta-xylanase
MENCKRSGQLLLLLGIALSFEGRAQAQSATVTLSSEKQSIRGYGGMQHAAWAGDMTAAERTLAFGTAAGQLGFSILRIPVTDGNPDSVNVATAKAAASAGAIVFATPWNAAKTYTSADFSSYLTHLNNFVSYMKNQGVDLYAISVQNEPDYGSQAGWGSWSAAACHDFVLNYGSMITTKLMSCESFNYQKSYYDALLNDSAALANVDIMGTHLYGTSVSAYAYPLFDSKGAGKERWMTEHYTDSTTDANSWPNALGVASEVHNAMVTGQFNAYVWWYIKRSYGFINNGAVTKRGDCIGHWSKFVRPGFHRVDATEKPASGLALSAYKGDSSVVIVIVNTNSGSSTLSISIPGSTLTSFTKYTTSSSKSLASDGMVSATGGMLSVTLDGSSVTSLVAEGSTGGSGGTGGMGGMPGSGGAGQGGRSGVAGAGGSARGGSPGNGGRPNASGGAPNNGGQPATGGTGTNSGGSAAVAGTSALGGSPSGMSGGSGGIAANVGGSSLGSGGSSATGTGGSSTSGGRASGGRTSGTGGTSTAATGGDTDFEGDSVNDSSGCGCRVATDERASSSGALLALLGIAAFRARRRRGERR